MNDTMAVRRGGSGLMRRPRASDLLGRELEMRGSSLEAFAGTLGLTAQRLLDMVEGREAMMPAVALELRESVGVEIGELLRAARAA